MHQNIIQKLYSRTHLKPYCLSLVYPWCFPEIDECLSSPCRHGGTCKDIVNMFECECIEGYSGASCEIGNQFNFLMGKMFVLFTGSIIL